MIGTSIESKRGWPPSAILFLLIAGASAILASVTTNMKDALPGLIGLGLFGLAGVARLLAGTPRFGLTFDEDHLEVYPARLMIPYAEMRGLRSEEVNLEKGQKEYRIEIVLEDRAIGIPDRMTAPSLEIEQFLLSKLVQLRLPLDYDVREFLERMVGEFGVERVWWTNGTPSGKRNYFNGRLLFASLLLIAASIVTMVILVQARRHDAPVPVCVIGISVGFVSALCSLSPNTRALGPSGLKDRAHATIIVTPLGLAMKQSDIQGEVSWDKIDDVQLRRAPGRYVPTTSGTQAGVILKLDGASVHLYDIYDRPLRELHERIVHYWR